MRPYLKLEPNIVIKPKQKILEDDQDEPKIKRTYWCCPEGCTSMKILFSDKCPVCKEDFMHFVLDTRQRTKKDLFDSDDESLEFWSCKKCKNHNIDINKNCSKCNRNKYLHDSQEKKEIKEKL